MADGYWNRQPTLHPSAGLFKRPRSEYEFSSSVVPSTHEMHNYLARDDDRGGPQVVKDTKAIGSAYEHFLQNKITSFSSGETSNFGGVGLGRTAGGGASGLSLTDPVAIGRSAAIGPDLTLNGRGMLFDGRLPMEARSGRGMGFDGRLPMDALSGRGMGLDGRLPMDAVSDRGIGLDDRLPMDAMPRPTRETLPLPPDASKTVYVEGLPPNSTRREVAHIFRPFVGYKEVRLVSKESKHRGGDPLILCFVDFTDPACAATALSALQGYKMDEHDPDSAYLRLQFSKFPGPRSASGSRRKR